MAVFCKFLTALLLISSVRAKPAATLLDNSNQFDFESTIDLDDKDLAAANVEPADEPQLYLIIASAANTRNERDAAGDVGVEKRSAEEVDDLETAAGTNVLRPLFVYRQQLAYRERVKKGASRRVGIRPRF